MVLKQKEPGLHPEHWEHLAAGSSAPFPVLGASPPTPLGDCFCPWAWGPWADLPGPSATGSHGASCSSHMVVVVQPFPA